MTLREWMEQNNIGVRELARTLNTSSENVSQWRRGRCPTQKWRERIRLLSDNAVTEFTPDD